MFEGWSFGKWKFGAGRKSNDFREALTGQDFESARRIYAVTRSRMDSQQRDKYDLIATDVASRWLDEPGSSYKLPMLAKEMSVIASPNFTGQALPQALGDHLVRNFAKGEVALPLDNGVDLFGRSDYRREFRAALGKTLDPQADAAGLYERGALGSALVEILKPERALIHDMVTPGVFRSAADCVGHKLVIEDKRSTVVSAIMNEMSVLAEVAAGRSPEATEAFAGAINKRGVLMAFRSETVPVPAPVVALAEDPVGPPAEIRLEQDEPFEPMIQPEPQPAPVPAPPVVKTFTLALVDRSEQKDGGSCTVLEFDRQSRKVTSYDTPEHYARCYRYSDFTPLIGLLDQAVALNKKDEGLFRDAGEELGRLERHRVAPKAGALVNT